MNPDLFWIPGPWQGKLAVVTRPRGGDWLGDEVGGWRRVGLDVVVSLLEASEAAELDLREEGRIAESEGIRFISYPIPDRGVPASTKDALSLLAKITTVLEDGHNVGVHCRQGIGRSGLIAAALLVASGIGVQNAVNVVSAARGQRIPETNAQLEWIERLPSEHPVLTSS